MAYLRKRNYPLNKRWRILFKDMGLPGKDILRHAGLPDLPNRDPPTVTAEEKFRIWESMAHVMRDTPAFPLKLAQAVTTEVFSPPVFACLCSDNLNIALKRLAQYKILESPLRLHLERDSQRTLVSVMGLSEVGSPPPNPMIAHELAFLVHISRLMTREHIIPASVHIAFELPAIEVYEAFFGVHISQDAFNGIAFSAEDAQRPFLTAGDNVWSTFEPELRKRLHDLTQEASFGERVRACLIETLASGQFSIADVAAKLALSSRTLQRRLQQENTTFKKILDDCREELALHYLSNSDYTYEQIAFLIGFEEPTSFYRAFRAWTGQTPESVRSSIRSANRSPI